MEEKKLYRFEFILVGICCVAAIASFIFARSTNAADGHVHVYFLDVGQGDAMFIVTPDGRQVLIDGGPDRSVVSRLGSVMPLSDRSIDLIISTHTDADHLHGLVDVLSSYDVGEIIETGMNCTTGICKSWDDASQKENAQKYFVHEGYRVFVSGDLEFIVMNPGESVRGETVSMTNNAGIVLLMRYKTQRILFAADIEKSVEHRLILQNAPVRADFLKVGHHGSKTSSTQEFLDAVHPQAAFIEVAAKNSYGHPSPEVIDRLEKNNIVVYRTDINGTVELVLDGTSSRIINHGNTSR